jgi:hypothetical protein
MNYQEIAVVKRNECGNICSQMYSTILIGGENKKKEYHEKQERAVSVCLCRTRLLLDADNHHKVRCLLTAVGFSPGGSGPYTIHIHK